MSIILLGEKRIFLMKNSRQHSKDSYFLIIQSGTSLGTAVNGFHKYDLSPKSVNLKIWKLSGWAWPNQECGLKAENFLWPVVEGRVREVWSMRKMWQSIASFKDGGGYIQGPESSLWLPREMPSQQAS